jgi:hypothetical protein
MLNYHHRSGWQALKELKRSRLYFFPSFAAHPLEGVYIVNIPTDELVLCQSLGLTYRAFSKKLKSSFQVKYVIFPIILILKF